MKIIISHPTSNQFNRALVKGLYELNKLAAFFTAIAVFSDQLLYRLGGLKFFKDLKRRSFEKKLQKHTKTKPFFEMGRLLSSKLKWYALIQHEKGIFCVDNIYHQQDLWVAKNLETAKKNEVEAVYAYEDGAIHTFTKAKELGIVCLYDLPIGYWKSARELLQNELEKNPEWAATITGFKDSHEKLTRKDRELALADQIFVASSFTKKTLQKYKGTLAPIKVIPYGFPPVINDKTYLPLQRRKLKVLFVGGLSQRKGISYLFDAVKGLKEQVSLTVVGKKAIPNCTALNKALEEHNYITSLPHQEVLECMQSHDVLVFPSLFEGFGMVITEAMSQGVPVITTDRTAGPDLITHGKDGWLVASASSEAIRNVLSELLENPSLLKTVGQAALEKAKSRPWSVYGNELARAL